MYEKLSKILEEVIKDFRQARITGAQYLRKATDIMDSVRNKRDKDTPVELIHEDIPRAFYGVTKEVFSKYTEQDDNSFAIKTALDVNEIVYGNKIIDWVHNKDNQNRIKNKIEDYLYELSDDNDLDMTFDDIDFVLDKVMEIALLRYAD